MSFAGGLVPPPSPEEDVDVKTAACVVINFCSGGFPATGWFREVVVLVAEAGFRLGAANFPQQWRMRVVEERSESPFMVFVGF